VTLACVGVAVAMIAPASASARVLRALPLTSAVHSLPIESVSTARRVVALTFDDGPDPKWTPKILDILRSQHVHATFFVLGSSVHEHPYLVRREASLHEEIGCHGWNHHAEAAWSRTTVVRIFRDCAGLVDRVAHQRPRFVRPPYGLLRTDQVHALEAAHFTVVDWSESASPMLGSAKLLDRYLDVIRPGTILLLHDGRHNRSDVVHALPSMIRQLRAEHFSFVTISALLTDGRERFDPTDDVCQRAKLYVGDGFVPGAELQACGRTTHHHSSHHAKARRHTTHHRSPRR
jgi:peptidoglycan/xylan/chitin deacetylase (PgdA/CDA1 family)